MLSYLIMCRVQMNSNNLNITKKYPYRTYMKIYKPFEFYCISSICFLLCPVSGLIMRGLTRKLPFS